MTQDFDLSYLAGHPDEMKAALVDADPATLMLVLVHLSGDASWLERTRPYISGPMNYHETMPEDLREDIRTALAEVLLDYARSGQPMPPIPDGQRLVDMLSVAAGEQVDADYVAMMHEDLEPSNDALRGMMWRRPPSPETLAAFHVVVIGAGMSGLCAAIRLQDAGIPFTIVEKNIGVGGAWFENTYPGCGVDTPNHFYSYSFEENHSWSHFYAKRDELWSYFEAAADKYGIRDKIRFQTEVTDCAFDETTQLWTVKTVAADGTIGELRANAVLSAVGILNRPKLPDIEGLESFAGPRIHTAQWDPNFDWRGKNVAMIGTGASGLQVGPTIAPDVEQLTVFQRSPHWMVPNPNYFAGVKDGKKWVLEHIPYYNRWYRFQLFWGFADGLFSSLEIDPEWDQPDLSVNRKNHRHREFMERHIRNEVDGDETLLRKVVPDYPPYTKRILIDNNWYRTLTRPNVDLVTEDIARIVPDGVVTADGKTWPADALVFATGFKASKMLMPMKVVGREGMDLHKVWKPDDATAYLGITVPSFPNFFILLGPNTGLGHGGNLIFMAECQVRFVLNCLREVIEGGHRSIEVLPDVHDDYIENVDAAHRKLVWSHKGAGSWFRNAAGRVFALLPFKLVDYWKMTARFNPGEFRFQ